MTKIVSLEDRAKVEDLLARYCFFVDEGESDAWADLWTEDGIFAGATPKPVAGREALKGVPIWSQSGGCRHSLVNLIMDYGETNDEMIVRGYNLVTNWLDDAKLGVLSVVRYHLVRRGDIWKIKSNAVRNLVPTNRPPGDLPEGFPYPSDQPTRFPPLS
jgi:hypothetical protein